MIPLYLRQGVREAQADRFSAWVAAAGEAGASRGQRGGVADVPDEHGPVVPAWCHPRCCHDHPGQRLQPLGVLRLLPCSGTA